MQADRHADRVVVTGGASRIGRGIARRFDEEGGEATCVETDVSDPDRCEALTVEEGERVIGVDLDGAFYCAKFAAFHLENPSSDLINV